jgi:hypothetical protein
VRPAGLSPAFLLGVYIRNVRTCNLRVALVARLDGVRIHAFITIFSAIGPVAYVRLFGRAEIFGAIVSVLSGRRIAA